MIINLATTSILNLVFDLYDLEEKLVKDGENKVYLDFSNSSFIKSWVYSIITS